MVRGIKEHLKYFINSKVRIGFLSRFVVVPFCILFFSAVALTSVCFLLSNKINEGNRLIINTVNKSLDDVFKNLDDAYITLEGMEEAQELFSDTGITRDLDTVSEFTRKANDIIKLYGYIEEIVLMKKHEDMLVTSQGTMDKRYFFNNIYNNETYGYAFYDNIITDYLNVKMIPSVYYKNLIKFPAESPQKHFVFVKTIASSDVNILMFISENSFMSATHLNEIRSKIKLTIYDYNNSVVFTNGDNTYFINIAVIEPDVNEVVVTDRLQRLYIKKSGYNYFYYVTQTVNVALLAAITGTAMLLSGFLLAVYILLKRARGVLIETDKIYSVLELEEGEGTLADVSERIEAIKLELSEEKHYSNLLKDDMKSNIFAKMVQTSSYVNKNKEMTSLIFDSILDCDEYIIIAMDVIDKPQKSSCYEENIMQRRLEQPGIKVVAVEESAESFVFIAGFSDSSLSNNLTERIEKILAEIRKHGSEVLVCYSKAFTDISNIYEAYIDIKICRDYRGINDKTTILNTHKTAYGARLYIPLNFRDELTSRMPDKEDTRAYLNKIFEINQKNNIPIIKFEYLLRIMQDTVMEVLLLNNKDAEGIFELEQVFASRIDYLKNNFNPDSFINSFLNLLHLSMRDYESKKNVLNRGDVIKYINSNFAEDLYLEKIASQFGTTQKYFSNYFKKEFSIGFNEYLTQVRITHAKKLLTESGALLHDVAEACGYHNQATFAIAFKKITNMPPGKYRDLNGK